MAGRVLVWTICLSLCTFTVLVAPGDTGSKSRSVVNCAIQKGPCSQFINGRSISFDVMPKPVTAMTELTFVVTVEGADQGTAAHVELNMLAMDMGKNHVLLRRNDNGAFVGQGVIVRCRSGIRTWSAKVVVSGIGATEFIFDVIY